MYFGDDFVTVTKLRNRNVSGVHFGMQESRSDA